ncbi:hypothetical protein M501DRAFT_129046 [Patellaria atrata CBS 101060]|uniref:Mid2 domain-containing protein n=1 Tax=Patellaria atrata CBS 101060 TaxID=1346257 RepID=A0A9P4VW67_9PEZI|nr:hypothetical protein M501DRAFT_129046 [Patellaria atrata CBS 101060]
MLARTLVVLGLTAGIAVAQDEKRELEKRQSAGFDSVSAASVLLTALPPSMISLAVTNTLALYSELQSQFASGATPTWFQNLPSDIQTFLVPSGIPIFDVPTTDVTSSIPAFTPLTNSRIITPPVTSFVTQTSSDTESTTSEESSTSTPAPTDDPDSGLSTGAKTGIGVGVALGVSAVLAIITFVFFSQRQKKKRKTNNAPPAPPQNFGNAPHMSNQGIANNYVGPQELDAGVEKPYPTAQNWQNTSQMYGNQAPHQYSNNQQAVWPVGGGSQQQFQPHQTQQYPQEMYADPRPQQPQMQQSQASYPQQ